MKKLTLLLLCTLISINTVMSDDETEPTLTAEQIANMHQMFMRNYDFTEALRTIAHAKADDAQPWIKEVAEQDMMVLRALLKSHESSPDVRKHLVESLRSQLADLDRNTPNNDVYGVISRDLEEVLDDTHALSPMGALTDTYGAGMASTAYYGLDGMLQNTQSEAFGDALIGTTPGQVWHGTRGENDFTKLSDGIGHLFGATQGSIPFVSAFGNKAAQHSLASKALGGTHLGTRTANMLYHWLTKDDVRLTPQEAHALAYHNRRNGSPAYLKAARKRAKMMSRFRVALRLLGQGVIPTALMGYHAPEDEKEQFTSPGLAVANTTGVIDSLLGMYDRYQTKATMQKLRDDIPAMLNALEEHPATENELSEDALLNDNVQLPSLSDLAAL